MGIRGLRFLPHSQLQHFRFRLHHGESAAAHAVLSDTIGQLLHHQGTQGAFSVLESLMFSSNCPINANTLLKQHSPFSSNAVTLPKLQVLRLGMSVKPAELVGYGRLNTPVLRRIELFAPDKGVAREIVSGVSK